MPLLKAGTEAPDFELPSADGKTVALHSFLGSKNVVLYFYPKDETSGCVREANRFRDSYQAFKAADAEVLGISADSPPKHRLFAANHQIPFPLLSDSENRVRAMYGAYALVSYPRLKVVGIPSALAACSSLGCAASSLERNSPLTGTRLPASWK